MRARKTLPVILLAIIGLFVPGTANAATQSPPLVIGQDFPDPSVTQVGSTYYAYSTSSGSGRIPYATAPAATGPWTVKGDALPSKPSWAGNGGFWAPDVSQRSDGKYLMYFAGPSVAQGRMCVGAAVASSPAGPYASVGGAPLVCNASEGGDIDPSSFVDTDGRRYLVYKNDGNAIGAPTIIWLQPVAADGVTMTGGRTELLRNDRPEVGGVIEAPKLVRRPSRYVLFYATGVYSQNTYSTSYGVSGSLTGPYAKAYRPLLTTGSLDGAVQGPGGADVLGAHIFFHGWLANGRGMYVADLGWANDYPVVRGSRVRYEAEQGAINDAVVRQTSSASQGAVVAKLDNADSWVDITVFAPTAGAYTAHVDYSAGYGAAQHLLTVNGAASQVVNYPQQAWETYNQVAVGVQLNAGWNTLRFQNHSGFAELDFVEVA
jgi:arabinan endo-1,5-alpha-L-arabinosidase